MNIIRSIAALSLAGFALVGCDTGPVVSNPEGISMLIAKECAIYAAAEQQLASEGRGADGKLSAGCPAGTAPANITATGTPGQATSFSETLYRRMIARGMPNDLALQISTSPAFKDIVAFQAANAS